MTDYYLIKSKLEVFPNFRERRFRNKYLAVLSLREVGKEAHLDSSLTLSMEELSDFAIRFDSLRHAWGEVLRENPSLRGKDYGDKEKVVQEKLIKMGYESGFNQKLKI